MNVVLDENLSIALARAFAALFIKSHEIIHMRERFGPAISDIEWINTLSAEGHWIVISGDRRITRNKAEYLAFRNSRLLGFSLSKALYKAPVVKQAERLALWNGIEKLATTMEGGAMFELPMKSSRIQQLRT